MTNKEWLDYLAQNAPDELAAWFDAERTESPKSDAMQHIGQVIENTIKRGVYGDTDAQNADSREKLEADIEVWASIMDLEDQIDTIHGWLNRRAAILEREMVKFNRRYFDCVEQDKKIAELTCKMEILKAHGVEIVDAVAGGYEVYNEKIREVSELQAQVDKLTAERDELQRHCENQRRELAELNNVVNVHRIVHEDGQVDVLSVRELCRRNDELTAERDHYREKFGKCLDYADAIHALMDDEGMA